MGNAEKIKVVFIGGFGRNGSTLLDRMLGQMRGFTSIGELRHIWDRGFSENQLCGCGSPFWDCPFWSAVIDEAFGGLDKVDIVETRRLRMSVDRLRYIPQLLFSRRSEGFARSLEIYSTMLEKIYKAVAKVSGCKVIVDSSKDPSHGLILCANPRVDLKYVLLLRDSRAVAFSWMRKKIRPEIHWKKEHMPVYSPLRTAAFWNMYNFISTSVSKKGVPFISVRYEDVVSHPKVTIESIARFAGADWNLNLDFVSDKNVTLNEGHLVAGNPMRFKKGLLNIRSDDEWKSRMSPFWKFLITCMTFPGLSKNDYF